MLIGKSHPICLFVKAIPDLVQLATPQSFCECGHIIVVSLHPGTSVTGNHIPAQFPPKGQK